MVKIVQNSFLGGQLDWEMMGRQDIEKYQKGATKLVNFQLLKRGGIYKRPGTGVLKDVSIYVTTTSNGVTTEKTHKLIPFAYGLDQGWCLLVVDGGMYAIHGNTVVSVTNSGSTWFTGSQVEEIDYCQCGDVVFLAHQDHPPCCVKHTLSGSTHVFTLSDIDFNRQREGIPEISTATVSKTGITTKAPTLTEHYKVTAVFDGVETYPSADYSDDDCFTSDGDCADYDTGYDSWRTNYSIDDPDYQSDKKTYTGTTYTLPWTTSQTIRLAIDMRGRQDADGVTEYPEEIRVYRKTGSYYGLVGRISLSDIASLATSTVASTYVNETYAPYVTGVTAPSGPTDITADTSCFGAFGSGYQLKGETKVVLTKSTNKVKVTLYLGHIQTVRTVSAGVTTYTFTYRPCGNGWFKLKFGSRSAKSVKDFSYSTETRTKTVTSTQDAAIDTTWKTHARQFAAEIGDAETISCTLSSTTAASEVTITSYVSGGSNTPFVVNHIDASSTDVDPSLLTFTDNYITPDTSITPPEETDVMQDEGDWPACVCVSQQRLIWASTRNDPSRVFMSQIGNFYTYAPHAVQLADDAIDFNVAATRFPKINHLLELRKILMFNGDAEWVVDSASASSGITYETIQAVRHSGIGCSSRLKPIVCNNCVLFVERTGQAVRQYSYQLEDDGYGGDDISIMSSSIFNEREIVSWAYQQHPHSTLWCVLSDGTLASLTFMREQNTIAWATHELGGSGKALEIVSTHELVGNANNASTTSGIYLLVKRGSAYTIERFRCDAKRDGDTVINSLCLDSMRVLSEGESARSGAVMVNASTGETVTEADEGVIEGFPYEARFESVYPVIADQVGLAQMDVKYVHGVALRLCHAVGGTVRAYGVPDAQKTALVNTVKSVSGETVSYPPVDERALLTADNSRDGRVVITHGEIWPFGLLMLETDIEVEEREGGR